MGQVERGQAEEVCRWGRWRYNCRRSAWSQMKEKGKAFLTHVWLRLETFSVHASHIELLPLQFWTFLNSIFSPYMAFYSPFCVYLRWAQSDMALLSSQSFLFLVNANVSWLQMIASDSGFFLKQNPSIIMHPPSELTVNQNFYHFLELYYQSKWTWILKHASVKEEQGQNTASLWEKKKIIYLRCPT